MEKAAGSIEIIGPQKDIALAIIKQAEPEIMRVLEQELKTRENFAKKRWPKRQRRYGRSSNSRNKFARTIRIVPPDSIEAALSNSAPYAWAIIAGKESNTPVKAGQAGCRCAYVATCKKISKNAN